ncbi:MAG: GNAT family N-acetyltransferase [Elusimicrobia bacterium]|nr:GNAT family N-acetyltransferase [Elusimicrobiota bacterium]
MWGIEIIRFDPLTAGEDLWKAHYDHLDAIHSEADPDEPLLPREKRRRQLVMSMDIPYNRRYFCLAMSGAEAAGYAMRAAETPASPSYATNKAKANIRLSVLPGYRRRGIGLSLLRHLAAETASSEPEVREFMTPVIIEAGDRFLSALGGNVALEQSESRLYLKDVDWDMVEAWAAEGTRRNPDTRMIDTASIPEDDLKAYSELYSEVINQQPLGGLRIRMEISPEQIRLHEKKNREAGAEEITIYAKEADGGLSGLTETSYQPEAGHRVHQMLTGVRESCRGRGLGRMLKALMLLEIRRRYPGVKYISTANSDANVPMLAINRKLGFRRHLPFRIYSLPLACVTEA